MKKILNLLAGVTLVASSAAPVVACGNKSNNGDQDKVNNIVKDITTKGITLPYGQGDYSFANDKTKLVNDLIKANPKLTADDAKYITLSPTGGDKIGMESPAVSHANVTVHVGKAVSNPIPVNYQVNNTWTQAKHATSGIPDDAKLIYAPVKVGSYYYVGSFKNGLWYSSNGLTGWKQVTTAATGTAKTNFLRSEIQKPPMNLGTTTAPLYYVATSKAGLWYSTNGVNWTQATGTTGFTDAYLVSPPIKGTNAYYVGSYGGAQNVGGIWKSTDGKTNWAPETGDHVIPVAKKIQAPITKLTSGSTIRYFAEAENGGIYQSTDLNDWSDTDQTGVVPTIAGYSAVAAPTEHDGVWYMPTTNEGLWTSGDAGSSWQQYGNAATQDPNKPMQESNFYSTPVIYGSYIYASSNNGTLWRGRITDKRGYDVVWVPVIPKGSANFTSSVGNLGTSDKPLYVQGSNALGVWTSTDGVHWAQNMTEGLTNANIVNTPVKIGSVYAAASDGTGNGLWTINTGQN